MRVLGELGELGESRGSLSGKGSRRTRRRIPFLYSRRLVGTRRVEPLGQLITLWSVPPSRNAGIGGKAAGKWTRPLPAPALERVRRSNFRTASRPTACRYPDSNYAGIRLNMQVRGGCYV